MERLQKVIATSGYCSRRKAEELITNGKVSVNGNIITTLGTKVKNNDEILVEGTVIDNKKSYEYYFRILTKREDPKTKNIWYDERITRPMLVTKDKKGKDVLIPRDKR